MLQLTDHHVAGKKRQEDIQPNGDALLSGETGRAEDLLSGG